MREKVKHILGTFLVVYTRYELIFGLFTPYELIFG